MQSDNMDNSTASALKVEYISLSEITPYEKNPRKNEKAVKPLMESIKEFGFKNPIILDEQHVIICGHTRYKAAKRLKMKEVPCIVARDLPPEKVKALRLADNKISEIADWDVDILQLELEELSELDIDMTQFGFDVADDFDTAEIIEDDVPEVDENEETRCKFGEIWELGKHRLMCGDSTSLSHVEMLLGGGY